MCKCSGNQTETSEAARAGASYEGADYEGGFDEAEGEDFVGFALPLLAALPKTPAKTPPRARPSAPAPTQTLPAACNAESVTKVGNVTLWRLKGDNSAFFFETGMTVDADGAPNAYHPNGLPGLDFLSNAGRRGNWWGLETDCDGNPVVQRHCDPFPGYYVSRTRLQDSDRCKSLVERQVDSTQIPYIVLPDSKLKGHWGNLKPGDFAFVINKANCRASGAIFADTKDRVGEGSIALATALGLPSDLRGRNAGTNSGIIYVVFPGSGNGQPRHPFWIAIAGESLFQKWGGAAKLADCFPGCPVITPTPAIPIQPSGGQQEFSTPRPRRSDMRYDFEFEAEPFQGYTEFDEAEWGEAESESDFEWPEELEFEGGAGAGAGAGLPGVVSQPYPQRSRPTNIRCPPGVTKTCPAIPNMLKVTSINGVGFEYVLGKGGIAKGTGGLWVVKNRNTVKQNFTPEVVKALTKFLSDMARFGMQVEAILTGGSYYCRCISNSSNLSNHSFGDAIDVVGIRWRGPSGSRETIVHNYANPQERAILRRINACLRLSFATVIDYHRSDHRDHFHCDTNRGRGRKVLGPSAINFIREAINLVLNLGLPEARYRKLDAGDGLSRVSGRTREQLKNQQVLNQTVDALFARVAQG